MAQLNSFILERRVTIEVLAFDLEGKIIGDFGSAKEASKMLKLKHPINVFQCINGALLLAEKKYFSWISLYIMPQKTIH